MPNNVRSVACLHCHVNESDEGLKTQSLCNKKAGFFLEFFFFFIFLPHFFKNIFEKHAAAGQARKSTSEIM